MICVSLGTKKNNTFYTKVSPLLLSYSRHPLWGTKEKANQKFACDAAPSVKATPSGTPPATSSFLKGDDVRHHKLCYFFYDSLPGTREFCKKKLTVFAVGKFTVCKATVNFLGTPPQIRNHNFKSSL